MINIEALLKASAILVENDDIHPQLKELAATSEKTEQLQALTAAYEMGRQHNIRES